MVAVEGIRTRLLLADEASDLATCPHRSFNLPHRRHIVKQRGPEPGAYSSASPDRAPGSISGTTM